MQLIHGDSMDARLVWFNQPEFRIQDGRVRITTESDTDFWQKTHYGFSRDSGHCLLCTVNSDFSLKVKTDFAAKNQYDQCGLIVRLDGENWIKTSAEYEDGEHYRLGSVATNLGFSDWATIDVKTPLTSMWYRIQSKNKLCDYLIEYSYDGKVWNQQRITHLLKSAGEVKIGLYACSPNKGGFNADFSFFELDATCWK